MYPPYTYTDLSVSIHPPPLHSLFLPRHPSHSLLPFSTLSPSISLSLYFSAFSCLPLPAFPFHPYSRFRSLCLAPRLSFRFEPRPPRLLFIPQQPCRSSHRAFSLSSLLYSTVVRSVSPFLSNNGFQVCIHTEFERVPLPVSLSVCVRKLYIYISERKRDCEWVVIGVRVDPCITTFTTKECVMYT